MTRNVVLLTPVLSLALAAPGIGQTPLPQPGFHHLHLNSTDPDGAIDLFTKYFTSSSRTTYDGKPALKIGKAWILINKVNSPPPLMPQTAVWHYGWNVVDERRDVPAIQAKGAKFLPLWTGDGDGFVTISSDSWPGAGGTLGRTIPQIAEAKAQNIKPNGGAGFAYIAGPDAAMVEVAGNFPQEYFNHVHMYQDDPLCAVLWYQKHLNVAPRAGRGAPATPPTEATCKVPRGEKTWVSLTKDGMYRYPSGGVSFDNIAMNWYVRPGDTPLVSTRGHGADHIALSVGDLDAWYAKLKAENVKILLEPYKLGDTRAFMVEGPSKEALELVEVK
jgi:hypothetical protein